ncbi:hypothetical protein Tco_0273181 [Tanacetum coccineum]
MTNLTNMLSKFVNSNTDSTSGSGTLPSNTITNPKVDLKGITTRSGIAYQGPTIPTTTSPPKVVEREPEVTKDTVLPINNGSTKDVQPPVVQVQSQVPNSEPVVDSVSALMPNLKPSIPYPSRRNNEKRREKANDQVEKFYKIFQDMRRSSYKARRALIDVYEGELTLRVGKEAITFNLDQTSRYSSNYDEMTGEPNRRDILFLESFLNDDPSLPPNQGNYLPEIQKELKICEAKNDKSSIDEPPESNSRDLPPHLEYAFLEGNNKLPIIIAKDLSVEEKAALIKVLKSHKQAIAWKLSDIKGINPEFCTHKILMEEDYKPAVQHQRQ